MPNPHRLQADDRDPDHIIRDQRDRIEELENLCDECHEVIREHAPGFTALLNKLEII